jgi:hypothetical protein
MIAYWRFGDAGLFLEVRASPGLEPRRGLLASRNVTTSATASSPNCSAHCDFVAVIKEFWWFIGPPTVPQRG